MSVKQFPRETDQGEVVEFLCRTGLPEDKKDDIIFKSHGTVTIRNLDNATSKMLIEAIHGKVNFGKKLYCNGIIPLTPEKEDPAPIVLESTDSKDVHTIPQPDSPA